MEILLQRIRIYRQTKVANFFPITHGEGGFIPVANVLIFFSA